MGEIIVPGETPEAAAKRQAEEVTARRQAEVDDWKEKLRLAAEDPTALAQLNEKSEYWRDRRGDEFRQAGGGFDVMGFRLATRTAAFQDLLDLIDPSGVLHKQYDVLFNIHAKHFFENALQSLPAIKEAQMRAEAHSFIQQQAHQAAKGNGKPGPRLN